MYLDLSHRHGHKKALAKIKDKGFQLEKVKTIEIRKQRLES